MNVEGLLVNIDGTLYVGGEPIPGAVEAMGSIGPAGVPFLYVTNTTCKPRRAVAECLRRMGFPCARGWFTLQPSLPAVCY